MIRILALLSTGVFFLNFTACKDSTDEATTAVDQAWPATLQTDRGNFRVTIRPEPGRISRSEHFSLEVSLDPSTSDATLAVNADMPAHKHGMNTKPEISKIEPHRFRVEGMLFHMAGDWVIDVDITQGTKTERASFPVHIE